MHHFVLHLIALRRIRIKSHCLRITRKYISFPDGLKIGLACIGLCNSLADWVESFQSVFIRVPILSLENMCRSEWFKGVQFDCWNRLINFNSIFVIRMSISWSVVNENDPQTSAINVVLRDIFLFKIFCLDSIVVQFCMTLLWWFQFEVSLKHFDK